MMHRVAASSQRQAELECALAEQRFRATEGLVRTHPPRPAPAVVSKHLDAAGKGLQACQVQLAAGQYPDGRLPCPANDAAPCG